MALPEAAADPRPRSLGTRVAQPREGRTSAAYRERMPETPVTKVAADALTPGHPTPGMVREAAVVFGDVWSGRVRTEPAGSIIQAIVARYGSEVKWMGSYVKLS